MAKDSMNVTLTEIFMNEVDPRRLQELRDSREIQEDHMAMANLPEKPINKIWQKNKVYKSPYIDYGISGD